MNATIGVEELESLKSEFKAYLREMNHDWNDSKVSTVVSGAFFALDNDVGIDLWESLINEESMFSARNGIRDFLAATKGSDRPDKLADDYLSNLQQLKGFLDAKHPTLPSDWKGKSISDVNLRSDFQAWMKKQKKSNGESYSDNTIAAYTTQLKNATARLGLGAAVFSDLFFYTSYDEFEAARKAILAAPNFNEVDAAASNKAYSNGMVQYAKFLKELGEPSAWIFQANKYNYNYLIDVGPVESLDKLTWGIKHHINQIKKGCKAYIWVPGTDQGIIASGTVLCDPEQRQPKDDQDNHGGPYDIYPSNPKPYWAVDIGIERKFTHNKVLRSVLQTDERTKRLPIVSSYYAGTNYSVTKAQEEVIESIINGSYERVPAVDEPEIEVVSKRRYWLYSPGQQAKFWDAFYNEGIMGIGWNKIGNLSEIGDLSQYDKKADIRAAMKKNYKEDQSYIIVGHALWQFAHEVAVGDIVYAKVGTEVIFGRGIVQSDYIYDESQSEFKHIHKVKWTQKGKWKNPEQPPMKILIDITPDTEYVQKLEALLVGESESPELDDESETQYHDYSEADFLKEVYISAERYATLKGLLLRKKNVILQGAPGVGKTFAAQRLAFSIMGKKDTSRVKIVQFHQSYSYEDFLMGYRPTENGGFTLVEGPFYKFCKVAKDDDERPYFFIIDEINRGNLSKIFGELLMLIEGDKRGEKNAIRLLYKDEKFYVPENVHIIGMMNTADRSLAMIDYALRRRFAFFDMEPAFQADGFKERQKTILNPKFDKLIATVESLNEEIGKDASLGMGFRIGHSYFCPPNNTVDDAWLSSVIEYELVPLLNEYWFDEPSKVENWTKILLDISKNG